MSRLAIAVLVMAALLCGCATGSGRPRSPVRSKGAEPEANLQASRRPPEPGPDGLMAGLVLFRYWRQESDKVKAHVEDISDRSKLFGKLVQHYRSVFEQMEQAQREGLDLLAREDREGAFARLNALWMALPVVTLQINYVVLASHEGGHYAGELATAFVPNQAELGAMLRRLGH